MRKQSSGVMIIVLLALLVAPLSAGAQDSSGLLVIWTTVEDARPVIEAVSGDFAAEFSVDVEVQYVRSQQLFESVSRTGGPDVILASNDDVGLLVDNDLVVDSRFSRVFFLEDVLAALPELLDDACPDDDIAACLWPRVSPTLAVSLPDSRLVGRTEEWVCSSADWMPMCGGDLPGEPLSWWFNVYLISDLWLAENGLLVPLNVAEIDELRSEYGLDYEVVQEDRLPLADSADPSTVYVFPSTLIVDDPQGLMRSLGSFDQAGYLPVLELGSDGLFVSAGSVDPGLAQEFVNFVASQPDAKLILMDETSVLPALDAAALAGFGLNTPESLTVLRAVTILSAYTQLVY